MSQASSYETVAVVEDDKMTLFNLAGKGWKPQRYTPINSLQLKMETNRVWKMVFLLGSMLDLSMEFNKAPDDGTPFP